MSMRALTCPQLSKLVTKRPDLLVAQHSLEMSRKRHDFKANIRLAFKLLLKSAIYFKDNGLTMGRDPSAWVNRLLWCPSFCASVVSWGVFENREGEKTRKRFTCDFSRLCPWCWCRARSAPAAAAIGKIRPAEGRWSVVRVNGSLFTTAGAVWRQLGTDQLNVLTALRQLDLPGALLVSFPIPAQPNVPVNEATYLSEILALVPAKLPDYADEFIQSFIVGGASWTRTLVDPAEQRLLKVYQNPDAKDAVPLCRISTHIESAKLEAAGAATRYPYWMIGDRYRDHALQALLTCPTRARLVTSFGNCRPKILATMPLISCMTAPEYEI